MTEYREELATRIADYERRYGVPSDAVHAAIDRGELVETHEVCEWLMDVDLLQRMRHDDARASKEAT